METTPRMPLSGATLPETLSCRNPATLEKLGDVPIFSRQQVVEAVARARRAQARWGQTSFAERRRVRLGGKRVAHGGGSFFAPTVLTGVTPEMRIAREETFGPVMCIFRVANEDAAVALANDSEYALGGTLFTTDAARAARLTQRLRSGSTVVNDFGMAYMANALPFGGVGGSGYGRLNGREGIRAMCNQKSVLRDRFPLHRPIKLYPVKDNEYARTLATIELIYRPWRGGVGAKIAALGKLVRAVLGR